MPQYTQEQLWKLYEKLSPELQEAVFSEENAEHIGAICERYGIEESKISEVAKLVGRVLLGILLPDDFQGALEETGLKKDVAKQVAHEINRFVFAPVKDQLNQLYHIGITPPEKSTAPSAAQAEVGAGQKVATPKETATAPSAEKKGGPDTYREPIE